MLGDKLADIAVFDRTSPLELLGRPLAMHLCVADLVPAGARLIARVAASVTLELELVPMDGRLIPTVVSSAAEAVVLDELVDGVDALLEIVIANQVAAAASGLLSGASLALPELPGLGAPADVTADAGGRYLRIRMR